MKDKDMCSVVGPDQIWTFDENGDMKWTQDYTCDVLWVCYRSTASDPPTCCNASSGSSFASI